MFRRQGPGRVGRAQVLETTEASSGRILPFLKLLEILRSFTIGSRAGAKTPPAPCVQAARAPSLRPRPGRHCPACRGRLGRVALPAAPQMWRGGTAAVAAVARGAGFGLGRGWRGAVGGPCGRAQAAISSIKRGALVGRVAGIEGVPNQRAPGSRSPGFSKRHQPESRFLETPSSSDLAAKSTGIDPRQSGRQLNGEFSPSAVRPRRGPGLVAIAPGRPVELAVGDGLWFVMILGALMRPSRGDGPVLRSARHTALPFVRPGLSLSEIGRRSCDRPRSKLGSSPCRGPALASARLMFDDAPLLLACCYV